jgi:hypothetical protein
LIFSYFSFYLCACGCGHSVYNPLFLFCFVTRNLMEIFDFGVTFVGPISPMFQERTKIQSFIPHMNIRCYSLKCSLLVYLGLVEILINA